jgi:hypothetical protein
MYSNKTGKIWNINFNIYKQSDLEVIALLEEHNGDIVKWHSSDAQLVHFSSVYFETNHFERLRFNLKNQGKHTEVCA